MVYKTVTLCLELNVVIGSLICGDYKSVYVRPHVEDKYFTYTW